MDTSLYASKREIGRATRGARPKEVPVLELDRLQDRDEEDAAAAVRVAGKSSALGDSRLSWGTAASPSNQKWDGRIENMLKMNASLAEYSESPQSLNRAESISRTSMNHQPYMKTPSLSLASFTELSHNHINTNHSRTKKLEAEDMTVERKKQAVIEQVMVDQLSRAVISDPEQNFPNSENVSARHRRTLHHTMVKTPKTLTESLLSHKLCFHARILSRCGHEACRDLIGFYFMCDQTLTVYEYRNFGKNRCNALPFIARGVYRTRGRPYCLHDFSQGAKLRFSTIGPHLPESLRQRPFLNLRITAVDEEAKSLLLCQSGETEHWLSKKEINDQKTLKAIQAAVHKRLAGHASQTLISLGRRLQSFDIKQNGLVSEQKLRESVMEELGLNQQDFEAVLRILGLQDELQVDYSDVMCAVIGEMSGTRKAAFLKVYVKLDPNKTGSVSLSDIEKFYCAKQYLHMEHEADFLSCVRDTGTVKNDVSYSEFEDFYEGLSIEITSDELYINILRTKWNI